MSQVKETVIVGRHFDGPEDMEVEMNEIPGKRVQDVPHGQVEAGLARLFSALGGNGEAVFKALNDPRQAIQIAKSLESGEWYPECSRAGVFREIMKTDFLGIKEIMKVWGVRVLSHQAFNFSRVDAILLEDGNGGTLSADKSEKVCREAAKEGNHVLTYYPGLTSGFLCEIGGSTPYKTTAKCTPGWYLIRKAVYPNSLNKSWEQQIALLDSATDAVPEGVVLTYAHRLCFLRSATIFLPGYANRFGRCSDMAIEKGRHTMSGFYQSGGPAYNMFAEVNNRTDDGPNEFIGLATIRVG